MTQTKPKRGVLKKRSSLASWLDRAVVLSMLLPIGLMAAVSAFDKSLSISATKREVQSTLDLVEAHARSVLKLQRVVLGAADQYFLGQSDRQILTNAQANHTYARLLRRYAGETLRLLVFSAEGTALVDSDLEHPDPSFDVSDREFFLIHRVYPSPDIYISGPSISRADGKPLFFISVRRSSPDGKFAGVVVVGVEHRTMFDFWNRDLPDPNSSTALIKSDGTYLVRQPPLDVARSTILSVNGKLDFLIGSGQERKVEAGVSPIDGVSRLFAYRRIDQFPALVTYGVSSDTVLEAWRVRLGIDLAVGTIVGLALAWLTFQIRIRNEELQHFNAFLESRVEQRTAELRASEKRIRFLAKEVDHRAKNALAVVQAVLRMTPRTEINRYVSEVEGRIRTLAHAQTLLSANKWKGVDLRDIINIDLRSFGIDGTQNRQQLYLDGDDIILPASATQPIAMVIHELSTNAVKYGALSVPDGRLSVTWWTHLDDAQEKLALYINWCETGGPSIASPPLAHGFGLRIIKPMIDVQLHGTFNVEWGIDGVKYEIKLPLDTKPDGDIIEKL